MQNVKRFFYVTCVKFEPVKSPEVTWCGWRGYKPSINKQTNKLYHRSNRNDTRFPSGLSVSMKKMKFV